MTTKLILISTEVGAQALSITQNIVLVERLSCLGPVSNHIKPPRFTVATFAPASM